jgi:beta-glucosidase
MTRLPAILFTIFLAALSLAQAQAQTFKYPYQNPSLPISTRVEDLLKRMSLEEKIAQLRHIHTEDYDAGGHPDMERLQAMTKGNSFGCIEGFGLTSEQYLKTLYLVQQYMRLHTRWGIPVIGVLEGLHGTVQDECTIFPQAIALASTFHPELVEAMTGYIAEEMKAIGGKQVFAPDLDLARELRWGRVEETYGEDPFLVGEMGAAYVRGLRKYNMICTPKHFVAHGSPVGGINLSAVEGGLKQLYSLYLPPFEKVIREADPLSIMNCYSSYDGEPVAGSSFFLTDLLRKQLGFKGYVYSDWGSVSMLYDFHHTAAGPADAAFQALTAGIDVEAASSTFENLDSLIKTGKLSPQYIDRGVRHVLYTKFKSGLFDEPLPDTTEAYQQHIHTPASIKLARTLADESIVLLKNDQHSLPLDESKISSLAVIGPNADELEVGDYTWSTGNQDGITPLQGLRKMAGDHIAFHYAKGCGLTGMDTSGFAEAVAAAQSSSIALVFVGSHSASLAKESYNPTSGEGFDLDDLTLPGAQEALVRAIQRTGKPVILVLVTGRPFVLSWEKANLPAIVVQWYGGEQEGNAIADMLFGHTNPSGKLPISFPQSTGNAPSYYNYLPTERGFYRSPGTEEHPGRDYVFAKPGALWSFGYGLSYTQFSFSDLRLSSQKVLSSDSIKVRIRVMNTGNRDGAEVVQLYVHDRVSSVETPVQALKAFRKVFLKAGEAQDVTLTLPISQLYLYNKALKKVVEPGDFDIQVGAASDDIRAHANITVYASARERDLTVVRTHNGNRPKTPSEGLTNAHQNRTTEITGTVRDIQSSVLPGVIVQVKGGPTSDTTSSTTSAITDVRGNYSIQAGSADTLIFTLKGYVTKQVEVGKIQVINVRLMSGD